MPGLVVAVRIFNVSQGGELGAVFCGYSLVEDEMSAAKILAKGLREQGIRRRYRGRWRCRALPGCDQRLRRRPA